MGEVIYLKDRNKKQEFTTWTIDEYNAVLEVLTTMPTSLLLSIMTFCRTLLRERESNKRSS